MNTNVTQTATIIATYSQRMLIERADGQVCFAKIKGKRLKPVCGDHIETSPIQNEDDWLINAIKPRSNELTRNNNNHKREIIAANISMIAILTSDPPKPDWFIVDRYIGAAESMGIKACVINNKADLNWCSPTYTKILDTYRKLGYPTIDCSAKKKSNLKAIMTLLQDEMTIFVGQSGVGKSSLINVIALESNQLTQEISTKKNEGRHTTVNSCILNLKFGGKVMDSPGVRDYSPIIDTAYQVAGSFIEIEAEGANCKYHNCQHIKENTCAVKVAVDEKRIDQRRYDSYKRLLNITQKSKENFY